MNNRYLGFDFARAIFMILGVIYHSALIYKMDGEWRVSYGDKSYFFDILSSFISMFRMEGFYIISGFFFVLIVEKYGVKKSIFDRLLRIGVPLIVFGLTFNTLMNMMSYNRVYSLSKEYFITGQWLGHLWFLGNLLCYYLLCSVFSSYFNTKNVKETSLIFIAFISLVITPVASVMASIIGREIYTGTFVFISSAKLYQYLPFFVLGMYFWRQRHQVVPYMTIRSALLSSLLFMISKLVVDHLMLEDISWSLYTLMTTICNTCLMFSVMFFLCAVGNKSARPIKNLVDSSYTIYLLHQPLIVIFFVLVWDKFKTSPSINFLLLSISVFIVAYYAHFFVAKKNALLIFAFNGRLKR